MVLVTKKKGRQEGLAGDKYFNLIEHAADGIAIIQDGVFKLVNTALSSICGYDKEELLGMPFTKLLTPESQKLTLARYQARLAGKKVPAVYEIQDLTKNGEIRDIEINAALTEYEGRAADEVIIRDITERKQTEQALRESEEEKNTIIEEAPVGICHTDLKGTIKYVNKRFEEESGYSREGIIGKNAFKLDWFPEGTLRYFMQRMAARLGGKPHRYWETQFKRKDGTWIWVTTEGKVIKKLGVPVGFQILASNITERKKREQLQDAENYVLTLLGQGANLSELLDAIVRLGEQNDPSIKGSVLLFDPSKSTELLFLASAPNLPKDYTELFEQGIPIGPKAGSCGTAAYLKERVIVPDIAKSPLFKPFKEVIERTINNNLLAVWSQPIIASDGELLGTIANYSDKVGEPSADNLRVLEWSARIAAIAIERKRAEDALRESEERYRAVIEGAHDMIQSVALDGSINFVNQAWLDTLGYNKADLPKLNLVKILHPDSLPHCQELFQKVVKGEPVHNVQATFLTKDGREILVEGNAAPRLIGDKVVATQGIFRDVTERKEMEQQLQEKNEQLDAQNEELRAINEELRATEEELQHSQERLERMFESVTDGIVVTTLDGTVLKVNERAAQMIGYASDDELLGKNCFDCVAPGDHEKMAKNMQKVIKEGLIKRQEYTMLKADGAEFPAELSTNILKDASGNVIGLITIARDITERKQMEKLFKTVTNSSQVGIYITQDGKFQMANPQFQKLTGFSEDELIGMDSLSLVLDEDRDMVRKNALKMLKGERSSPYQFRVVNKAGENRWVMETVSSIPYRGRRAILGNCMDISERRQTEEREKQLEQELNLAGRLASIGQLAAGVAHEINNPLTGVIGFSHLMLSRDIPDDIKQDLQVIHSEAQRVAKIVENLLVFAHQRKTGREYVDINEIINRVLELRAYEMKVNNIEVEPRLDPELPLTIADAGQLQQVFLNIVLNAEHFMVKAHNRGRLLVKTEKANGNIRASFTDDGTGISLENLDKIFNPFFTTKEVGKGTGLGLSICHSIITQHQGRIYAQSQLGKGATFVIELPIVAEPVQTEKAEESKKEPQKSRGAKILVVDDEQAILTFLSRLLTEWGHTVETINNADAALERLKTERYSLILLDIKLPGMSGIELYHHIEETVPALTRRVIFITGDVMESTTRDFLEKTKAAHITKPLDIEVLKKMINRALNQAQSVPVAQG
jgi:PAS domain S-box-containing protein